MSELKELLDFLKGWLELLFPLIIFLLLFLFRYGAQFLKAKRLKEIAPFINGEVVLWPFFPPKIQGTYMGMSYQMSFVAEGRNAPGRLLVKLGFPCSFGMEIRPKGKLQGLTDLLSTGKPHETGEDVFDSQLAVKVDREKESAEVYLSHPANRETLLTVFRDGFASVRYARDGITLTRHGNFLTGEFTPDQALRNLTMAGRLVQRV